MLLNARQLATYLNIGRDRSYALMKSSGFPSVKIGSRYYVDTQMLDHWIKSYAGKRYIL